MKEPAKAVYAPLKHFKMGLVPYLVDLIKQANPGITQYDFHDTFQLFLERGRVEGGVTHHPKIHVKVKEKHRYTGESEVVLTIQSVNWLDTYAEYQLEEEYQFALVDKFADMISKYGIKLGVPVMTDSNLLLPIAPYDITLFDSHKIELDPSKDYSFGLLSIVEMNGEEYNFPSVNFIKDKSGSGHTLPVDENDRYTRPPHEREDPVIEENDDLDHD